MQIRASIPIAGWAGMRTGSSGGADAVAEERVAGGVGRRAAEDARGAHGVELAELDAVGERAQVDVVDQHRPPEPDAQRVDDLLEPAPRRIMAHTTSPWRIVSSVTTRGSTNCSR